MSDGDLGLGTRKTLFVLVIVVGCFAVLWPKVFYPMLVGPANQRMKPSSLDKGCCDVLSDIDVNTIKILSELCNNLVQHTDKKPLKGQEIITQCRNEILKKCGIDISAIFEEQVRLGHTFKEILDQVRSLNGSLCLKYKFGISPWRLGATHKVTVNLSPVYIRQERPAHLRPEMLHPALREKGRAIAQPYQPPTKGTPPKFVEGRPGPVPGVRPPMGGAGHVVHPPKGTSSMGVIMPIYTIGIVIFFSYTLMKLLFKKKPEGPGAPLYPPVEPSMTFRREVFESQKSRPPPGPASIVNAMTALLDEVDQEMEARRRASEVASQKEPTSNGTVLANGNAKQSQEHEQPSVKVLGMEMTASCEGGERWSRPESPVMPNTPPPPPEPTEPPQEIYLEGALPAQSQILVADSTTTTEAEPDVSSSSPDPAVVLASKMTLSVISLDSQESENEIEAAERAKLRNGDVETEHETLDDDAVDESKYTTASGATAAERDISEGEQTDEERDMEEDIEKVPEFVVDNGVQQIEDIEDLHDDVELNLGEGTDENVEIDVKFSEDSKAVNFVSPEDVERIGDVIDDVIDTGTRMSELKIETDQEKVRESAVKFLESDDQEKIQKSAVKFLESDDEEKIRESAVKFLENDDEKEIDVMSAEAIESIGDVIDDVINVGTRMSELISAEREAESDEEKENLAETNKVTIKTTQEKEPIESESEEEEIETEDSPVKRTKKVEPTQKKAKPVESESEEEEEIEIEEVEEEEEEEEED